MGTEAGTVYAEVYKNLANAGVTVNAAAGNSYSSAYSNYSGRNKPYASDPDAGTLSEPAPPEKLRGAGLCSTIR